MHQFIPARATASPVTRSQSLRVRPRSFGRDHSSRTTAAVASLSHTMPVGLARPKRCLAIAAPIWTVAMLPRTSQTAPGRARRGLLPVLTRFTLRLGSSPTARLVGLDPDVPASTVTEPLEAWTVAALTCCLDGNATAADRWPLRLGQDSGRVGVACPVGARGCTTRRDRGRLPRPRASHAVGAPPRGTEPRRGLGQLSRTGLRAPDLQQYDRPAPRGRAGCGHG